MNDGIGKWTFRKTEGEGSGDWRIETKDQRDGENECGIETEEIGDSEPERIGGQSHWNV